MWGTYDVLDYCYLGYIQKFEAENALAALAASITTEVTVIPQRQEQTIPSLDNVTNFSPLY